MTAAAQRQQVHCVRGGTKQQFNRRNGTKNDTAIVELVYLAAAALIALVATSESTKAMLYFSTLCLQSRDRHIIRISIKTREKKTQNTKSVEYKKSQGEKLN